MLPPIYASSGMAREVGGLITEVSGTDIHADAVLMGLSEAPTILPTQWLQPSTLVAVQPSVLKALLRIDNTTPAGTYWIWAKIVDGLDTEPLLFEEPVRVL